MPINEANKINMKSQIEKIEWVSPFFSVLKVTILCRKKYSLLWNVHKGVETGPTSVTVCV